MALPDIFPEEILDFFTLAGIDIEKDSEVYEFTETVSGEHSYGGEYHLWGKVLTSPDTVVTIAENYSFEFGARSQLAQKEFNRADALCFSFSTLVPWLLNNKPV